MAQLFMSAIAPKKRMFVKKAKSVIGRPVKSLGGLFVFLAVAVLVIIPLRLNAQSSGVLREVFANINGTSLPDLTNNAAYPASPTEEYVDSSFEAPPNFGDYYGQRMMALLTAPISGNYVFYVATDDQGALFLSTDDTPANKVMIARVTSWCSSREWNKEATQKSASISLVAGKRYYIEALQKEGAGGDNLAVTWQRPGDSVPANNAAPIPGTYLTPYGLAAPMIAAQPANATIVEGNNGSFTVRLKRYIGATFQWTRNGATIPGATNATYGFGPVSLQDSGSTYQCRIVNSLGATNTSVVSLTVTPDITRPTVVGVGNLGETTVLSVFFSEPVTPTTALDAANYSIADRNINVLRVAQGPDARTVILSTDPLPVNVTNILRVSNIKDLASTPNTILPDSAAPFVVMTRPLDIGYLKPGLEPPGPSSRRHGLVISEIMYHPLERADGKNLEFIEIYNSQPWFEEIGGWKISGDVEYTFPSNTVIQPRSYKVIAANPVDFRSVYSSISGVLGPFKNTNNLPNDTGTLRLRNLQGAVLFETTYADHGDWPPGADGTGHSLILARPSYGEHDSMAWDTSDLIGGSPGTNDTRASNPLRSVMINEIYAGGGGAADGYVELFNYSPNVAVNLNGCSLTDDPITNKCVISGVTIPAGGFVAFSEQQLGFAPSRQGGSIYFKNAAGTRVVETIRHGALEYGIPIGRFPDGASRLRRLQNPSPGAGNAGWKPSEIVINEIMYDPISGDSNDEYVELHNRTANPVNVGGWGLKGAISHTLSQGVIIPPAGYLVVAKNASRLQTNYAGLNGANVLGDYAGSLANKGERLVLYKPDYRYVTNALGGVEEKVDAVEMDEVSYRAGGRWGKWAAGGGSSLELCDARTDGQAAPNWSDSDETQKSDWVNVEFTGVMDNGWADAYQLHVTLLGAGEALLDNVEVIPAGGANQVSNGTFERDASGWVFQGNHNATSWESGAGYNNSSGSLHLRATGRGDTGANRVRVQLLTTLSSGTTVTLRAKARWLKGNPCLLLRLRGNWLEAPGFLLTAKNLGTPGMPNSRRVANIGPAITEVHHWPILPPAAAPILVTANVQDPDNLSYLALKYRVDPATNYTSVPMTNNGAGVYSASVPGQASGASVAFFIQALDNHSAPQASQFPSDAPVRECVVRWGDALIPGTLGIYRMWISETNVGRWIAEEKMSNNPKDVTFIYGTNRVVYNAGAIFHGSPYHSPSYNSPNGNPCDYDMFFPPDDLLLGETDINLFQPGNGGGDGTAQAEIQGYWIGNQLGLPFLYCRPIFVYANGLRRGTAFYDAQQPNGDYVRQWYPDDADGDLHKVQIGFEFGDQAYGNGEAGYATVGADLNRYTTTGGAFKQARYRQTWPRRSAPVQELHDYTNIFNLVNTAQTSQSIGTEGYTRVLTADVDVEEWFRVHVTQHIYNNNDSFSYGGGQNAFVYKPERDTWKLFIWDNDFAFGGSATDPNLFSIGNAEHGPRNSHPPFARIYWQALIEAVNGPLTATRANPIIDSRYSGMTGGGAAVSSPQAIKDFIAQRRAYIQSVITSNQVVFRITSNGGADFSTNKNSVTISGSAPLEVRTLLVNGNPLKVTWTSVSTWTARLPLPDAGTNVLRFTAANTLGQTVAGVSNVLRVNYTGTPEPVTRVVINEIHYNPLAPDTGFIELFNAASNTTYDISGWRLDGVGFVFPVGTFIEPGQYIVVPANAYAFSATFKTVFNTVGAFPGKLDNGGETLRLVKPGLTADQDLIADVVTYDDDPPWPAGADGGGFSLQLIDPMQDHDRAANWYGGVQDPYGWKLMTTNTMMTGTNMYIWLDSIGDCYIDDIELIPQAGAMAGMNVLSNGGFEFPLSAGWSFAGTNLTNSAVTYENPRSGTASLHIVSTAAGTANRAMVQIFSPSAAGVTNTLRFWYRVGSAGVNLYVRTFPGSLMNVKANLQPLANIVYNTPGTINSARASLPAFPDVWLNEVQPTNSSGITDGSGEREPWVELFNSGSSNLSLSGFALSDNLGRLDQWVFPSNAVIAPGQFLLVWLDGETAETTSEELHAGFRPASLSGMIVLSKIINSQYAALDLLRYTVPASGWSYGAYPDGNRHSRMNMYRPTPRGTNDPSSISVQLYINEWMADNQSILADAADGQYKDWFEIYNPGSTPVLLDGCYLTDNLDDRSLFAIPSGYSVPPQGFLLVWADGLPGLNKPESSDLHVGFKLDRGGESIGLFASDLSLIDAVTFAAQSPNVSQGRMPDGSTNWFALTNATPREFNLKSSPLVNTPPKISLLTLENQALKFHLNVNPAKSYQMQYNENLGKDFWSNLGIAIYPTNTNWIFIDGDRSSARRFYRLMQKE